MKLLLTSAGVRNASIHNALTNMLGKPVAECNALCIPTAIYPFPGGPGMAYKFITGAAPTPLCELGWKSLGVLEPSVLPAISPEVWQAEVQAADALLVYGGDPLFLRHWMRRSGLADFLREAKRELLYVGVSAGSMVTTAHIGECYPGRKPIADEDIQLEEFSLPKPDGTQLNLNFAVAPGLGLTDFSIYPHLEDEHMVDTKLENVELWASRVPVPLYAIDDETAIQVVDGKVEVVSEGQWKRFEPNG